MKSATKKTNKTGTSADNKSNASKSRASNSPMSKLRGKSAIGSAFSSNDDGEEYQNYMEDKRKAESML